MHNANITQVDILISKNQALQILYLKHCVYKTTEVELPWIRNLRNPQTFILNNAYSVKYKQ